ncbi:hypothetical protein CH76_12085 [Lysinibacillus sp. BF-4]|uniref:hypothetical protein n=1 Tax=Lysinibacillus sp. BF-4 TaxID=1473546 RepID=UPI0004FFC7C3|nr:hypothetical protein [Lysinibacillus sp. BF-4]KFL42495.1 hypothetical protein CH76_12085 [Lysinibacillus sp. BF-4]
MTHLLKLMASKWHLLSNRQVSCNTKADSVQDVARALANKVAESPEHVEYANDSKHVNTEGHLVNLQTKVRLRDKFD